MPLLGSELEDDPRMAPPAGGAPVLMPWLALVLGLVPGLALLSICLVLESPGAPGDNSVDLFGMVLQDDKEVKAATASTAMGVSFDDDFICMGIETKFRRQDGIPRVAPFAMAVPH